ncbi:MAG: hypothetical protein HC842_08020, partial [Cytophagales bacterium]|nr:hypothetical protein [Cytophagales bacterium]
YPHHPLDGMGHGHYLVYDPKTGEEVFEIMARARHTAYPEFGAPAPASVAVLQSFIPEEELFPPRPGTAWESHHAFRAWDYQPDTWLAPSTLERYFGPTESLEELVERGQYLQSAAYQCVYEAARRQKPYCSMALNWCLNEPWPTAANNSLLSWPCVPKPALAVVTASCRPVLFSAVFAKLRWTQGELLELDLWLLSDAPHALPSLEVEVWLALGPEQNHLLTWNTRPQPANQNQPGPTVRWQLGTGPGRWLEIELRCPQRPEYNSRYRLLYEQRHSQTTGIYSMNV